MTDKLTIKLYNGDAAFEALRDDWRKLYAASECAPFLSWEWSAAWFRFFGANRSPFVLAAYSDSVLVALLPLCFERKKLLGMPFGKLTFINSEIGGAAYLDVLALPAAQSAAAAAFWEFLDKRTEVDCLEFESITADSEFLKQFRQRKNNSNFSVNVVPHDVCQFAEVENEPDEFLKRIFNDTAKKKLKRIKKLPGFEFRRTTEAAQTEAAFRRFVRLHDGNWTQKGGSDVSGHPRLLDFHLAAVAAIAPTGRLFFDELWVEGKCVASLYGFQTGVAYFYYSSGYDEELVKLSPMVTLYNLSIENGLVNNVRHFDFLRGSQSYKAHWTNGKTELVTIRLNRKTVPALLHETVVQTRRGLRDFSNSRLPVGVLQRLKDARRKWKRKNQLSGLATEKTVEAL